MSVVTDLEAAMLSAVKSMPLPQPESALRDAVFKAAENPTASNIVETIKDVLAVYQTFAAPTTGVAGAAQ